MGDSIGRRELLAGAGAAMLVGALQGCSVGTLSGRASTQPTPILQLPRLHASPDRITNITVCTRPFRAQGPRLDAQTIGSKTVVHNYGHGGSGWSLSWGSSALGLTSSLLLQRAGARVTIYAKDLPPNVRSSLATGVWTPDSRICLEENATPAFKQLWEGMARQSFQTYQTLLGLPGNPVEFIDNYFVSDAPRAPGGSPPPDNGKPPFAELQRELIPDLIPNAEDFGPGQHNFGTHYLRRNTMMMFNLTAYARMLLADFHANGGKIDIREFHSPADFSPLPEKTLINATGYGSRSLFGDQSVTPVRGQLARMIPDTTVNYGLYYKRVAFVPRRDGLVFQVVGEDEYYGFDNDSTTPDRAEAELAVNTIAGLFAPA
jgi:FAD dependent oxidoreductase